VLDFPAFSASFSPSTLHSGPRQYLFESQWNDLKTCQALM
jgi:hypothetical protein